MPTATPTRAKSNALPESNSPVRNAVRQRGEPGKLPASLLAIGVHIGFFAVLFFGVSWQVNHPAPAVAEIWNKLPPIKNVPVKEPPPEPVKPPEEPPQPVKPAPPVKPAEPVPSKADIDLKAKQAEKKKQVEKKQEELKKEVARKQRLAEEAEKKRLAEEARLATQEAQRIADEKARVEEAARAATSAALDDYAGKIRNLIKNRANIPDSVTGSPTVEIRLRLLVNGRVFDAQLIKPSGNRVYDEAVERAINGIQNWPLPDNPSVLGNRREITLRITHEK